MEDENLIRNARVVAGVPAREGLRPAYNESWAVIVGINNYRNLRPLNYAVSDANGIADLLKKDFGFKEDIKPLLNEEATQNKILEKINELVELTKPDDRVLIFFAGHGETRTFPNGEKRGFIAPVEAMPLGTGPGAWLSYLEINRIIDAINFAAAKHVLCIFDSCFSGLPTQRADVTPTRFRQDMLTRRARMALTAGLENQVVADGGPNGHSVFTYNLIEGLKDIARRSKDEIATASELGIRIKNEVGQGSNQTPDFRFLSGHESGGDFVFMSSAPRLDPDLVAMLDSKRADVRIKALQRLNSLPEPRSDALLALYREKLAEGLKDDVDTVRIQAARSFSDLQDPLSLESLVESLFDSAPGVRKMVVYAMGQIKDPKIIDPLVKKLQEDKDDDPTVREAAAKVLGGVKDSKATQALGFALENDEADEVRIQAAQSLKMMGDPAAFDSLIKGLEDPTPDVRSWAAQGLSVLGDGRAVYKLSRVLLSDSKGKVRSYAAQALGRLQDPRAAASLMISLEYDENSTVRYDAIMALRNSSQPDSMDFIAIALKDPESKVRRAAIEALGTANHPHAVACLAEALRKDDEAAVRVAAAKALSGISYLHPDAVSSLIAALQDSDVAVRKHAVQALASVRAAEAAEPLVPLLKDSDPSMRRLIAATLGDLANAKVADPLFDLLKDEDQATQQAAAIALGKLGDERASDSLVQALGTDEVGIRVEAARIMGELKKQGAIPHLKLKLDQDVAPAVRAAAAISLGNFALPELGETLVKALKQDQSAEVRSAAASALGTLKDQAYLQTMIDALQKEGEEEVVRGSLIEALAGIGGKPVVDALITILDDPSDNLRLSAIQALEDMQDPAATEPLSKVLRQDPDATVRLYAAQALTYLGNPDALPAFSEALNDKDPIVRSTAVSALGLLGKEEVFEKIIELLQDKDEWVRQSTAAVLGDIGDKRAIEPLIKAIEDESPHVAAWAIAALGKLEAIEAVGQLKNFYGQQNKLEIWIAWTLGRLKDDDALNLFLF
jgi:HEAT repeat protein